MSIEKAIEILKYHNTWRRGDVDEMKYTAMQLGIAIDTIIDYLEKL